MWILFYIHMDRNTIRRYRVSYIAHTKPDWNFRISFYSYETSNFFSLYTSNFIIDPSGSFLLRLTSNLFINVRKSGSKVTIKWRIPSLFSYWAGVNYVGELKPYVFLYRVINWSNVPHLSTDAYSSWITSEMCSVQGIFTHLCIHMWLFYL